MMNSESPFTIFFVMVTVSLRIILSCIVVVLKSHGFIIRRHAANRYKSSLKSWLILNDRFRFITQWSVVTYVYFYFSADCLFPGLVCGPWSLEIFFGCDWTLKRRSSCMASILIFEPRCWIVLTTVSTWPPDEQNMKNENIESRTKLIDHISRWHKTAGLAGLYWIRWLISPMYTFCFLWVRVLSSAVRPKLAVIHIFRVLHYWSLLPCMRVCDGVGL